YSDPHFHLRLRFQGDPARLQAQVLPRLQAALGQLLADGRAWKVQLDTYEREAERYGGPEGIGPCEELFHHDSEARAGLLGLLGDDGRGASRWQLALVGMDRLLDDLGLDLGGKLAVLGRTRDAFTRTVRADAGARQRLGARYRREAGEVGRLLGGDGGAAPELAAGLQGLRRRSERQAAAAAALRAAAPAGRVTPPIPQIRPGLLHMHVNRLLRSAHHLQEPVLYDFLYRYYAGLSARR